MDDEGGRAAIEALNGKEFHDRPLTINEARPREEGGGGDKPDGYQALNQAFANKPHHSKSDSL